MHASGLDAERTRENKMNPHNELLDHIQSLKIISPEAARRALVEWLDAVPANKISAFGGDYCFVDGVYGHQFLARQNVAAALAQKVADGTFSLSRAKEVAGWLLVENPKRLFGLDRFLVARGD